MTFLFAPSLCVAIIFLLLFFIKFEFDKVTYFLINSSFTFLWIYMLLSGVYNIAYVESKWLFVYLIVSGTIFLGAIIYEIVMRIRNHNKLEETKE